MTIASAAQRPPALPLSTFGGGGADRSLHIWSGRRVTQASYSRSQGNRLVRKLAHLGIFGDRLGRKFVVPNERTRVLGLKGPRRRKAAAPEDASHLALLDSAGYEMGQNPLCNETAAALLHRGSVAVVTCLSGVDCCISGFRADCLKRNRHLLGSVVRRYGVVGTGSYSCLPS